MFLKNSFLALISLLFISLAHAESTKMPLIKAGTIVMANLDTPLDSSNPNALITATINHGKFKGSKLTGRLIENETDNDIPTLHFTSIKLNGKSLKAKSFNAYAIDFDEARIATVRQSDFDELQREFKTLAKSFLKVYATNEDSFKLGPGTELGVLIMTDV